MIDPNAGCGTYHVWEIPGNGGVGTSLYGLFDGVRQPSDETGGKRKNSGNDKDMKP